MGFNLVYLEAGSGASESVPLQTIKMVASTVDLPIITGGGIETPEQALKVKEAGANMIVQGTFIERTVLKDKGAKLREIIKKIKK